ncbi:MAG: ankyrin repeat domain-containing protein [Rhizobiales bacterium]|nr:ankyrin repeat domain-containing protein [Hyphomicrobiales bacterium]
MSCISTTASRSARASWCWTISSAAAFCSNHPIERDPPQLYYRHSYNQSRVHDQHIQSQRSPRRRVGNRYGGNALIPACERAHVETIELLLTTKIDVNHVNNLGWTCLLEIVILGDGGERHQQAAKLVLAAGADPNLADKDGVSPLAHARKNGQEEVAKLIEAAGGR